MERSSSSSTEHQLLIDPRHSANGVEVVRLQGEADLHTAPVLRNALNEAIERDPKTIVIDLTDVTFIDSMMLGVLLGGSRHARPRGIELRIVVAEAHVRRIFELTLLDQVMQLYPSLEDALASDGASGE